MSQAWQLEKVAIGTGDEITNSLADRVNDLADTAEISLPLFAGTIYYVDAAMPDDTGDGLTHDTAKETIGAAVALLDPGDAISVKSGTYAENVVLDVASCELWIELGTVIAPVAGTPLTVSGNNCKVWSPGGALFITPPAGATGVVVSGDRCYIHDARVNCGTLAANIGFDITGNGNELRHCRCADPLVVAFKVQGDITRLLDCCAGGTPADGSIGYWVTNACTKARLDNCCSDGHAGGSVIVDADTTATLVRNCASGIDDGRWQDTGHVAGWPGWTYDDIADVLETMDGATSHNLFEITGTVRIDDVYGIVRTQITDLASTLHLEAYSVGGSADITDSPGTDVANAPVGTTLTRLGDATVAIQLQSSATPGILESANWFTPDVPVYVIADADEDTFIRTVYSAGLAAGVIRWHCHWEPVSDDGFVAVV